MASSITAMPLTVNESYASSILAVPATLKTCCRCKSEKPLTAFGKRREGLTGACKECLNAFYRSRYAGLNKVARRGWNIRKYGVTPEIVEQIFESQGRCCAICKGDSPGFKKKTWSVDHNHVTNQVRGILCHHCNVMLGYSKDSVETHKAAIAYLNQYA